MSELTDKELKCYIDDIIHNKVVLRPDETFYIEAWLRMKKEASKQKTIDKYMVK